MAKSYAVKSGSLIYRHFMSWTVLLLLIMVSASLAKAEEARLAIKGNIESEHGAIYFSPGDMAASTPVEIVTTSPWTTGKTRFRGVFLRDILSKVEAEGTVLKAMAKDGYTVEIPLSDATDYDMIIAYKMDGEWLEEDVYAPFWIIYPYDTDKELAQEKYYGRSIWQLTELTVE